MVQEKIVETSSEYLIDSSTTFKSELTKLKYWAIPEAYQLSSTHRRDKLDKLLKIKNFPGYQIEDNRQIMRSESFILYFVN
jgi:hypothetical protein